MGEFIFYAFLTFFSAYGVFSFLFFLLDFLSERKHLRGKTLYSLLLVKDEACTAENMVKSLLFKIFKNDVGLCERKIIVVDMGSSDGTYVTLKRLFGRKNGIAVLKKAEMEEKLEKL